MDIQQLRQSLKMKWLNYYEQNRLWLVKMQIWHTYGDLRRPSSGYILATLSVLEPEFQETLPFILDLNQNPDEIISALGLHFNPDAELSALNSAGNEKPPFHPYIAEHKQVLFRITRGGEKNPQPIPVITVINQAEHALGKTAVLNKPGSRNDSVPKTWRTIGVEIPKSLLAESSLPAITQLTKNQKSPGLSPKNIALSTNARNLPSWVDEFCSGVGE